MPRIEEADYFHIHHSTYSLMIYMILILKEICPLDCSFWSCIFRFSFFIFILRCVVSCCIYIYFWVFSMNNLPRMKICFKYQVDMYVFNHFIDKISGSQQHLFRCNGAWFEWVFCLFWRNRMHWHAEVCVLFPLLVLIFLYLPPYEEIKRYNNQLLDSKSLGQSYLFSLFF